MLVTSLEKMEKIVAKNKNLSWIGWDVAERKRTDVARTSVNGVRVNNEWYIQKIYSVTQRGWEIPNKYKV